MAKSQTKSATKNSEDLINQAKTEGSAVQADLQRGLESARGRQQTTFTNAMEGIKQQQQTGGYDPGRLDTIRQSADNLVRSGGYDPSVLQGLRSSIQSQQQTGGYNPDSLDYLRTQGRNFTETGGYDAASLDKVRSGYGSFIDNGGFSDKERSDFLNSATSGVGATSRILQAKAAADRAKTGGMGSGGAAAQMARQLAQEQSQAGLNARTGLNQQISANKLSGLKGLDTTETNLAGLKQSGYGALAGVEKDVAGGTRAGNENAIKLEGDVAGGVRQGAGLQANIEGNVAQGVQGGNQLAAQLYNTTSGEVSDMGKQVLSALGLKFNTQQEAINALTQLSKNPGFLQTLMGDAIGLMGAWPKGGG